MKKLKFQFLLLILFIISVSAGLPRISRSESEGFEMIYDLDLGYFLVNPKRPWAGDPFERSPGFSAKSEEAVKDKLTSIIYDEESPRAIINDRAVSVGDRVGSRVVIEIGENFVILKRGGSEVELTLPASDDVLDLDEDDKVTEENP